MHLLAMLPRDPRYLQIAVLTSLLVYGLHGLSFEITTLQVTATLGVALVTQALWTSALHIPRFDPRSPLITALSLCLLLRTDSLLIAAAATFFAITSKFAIRRQGKHIFNPANVALAAAMLTGHAWVAPAQWGRFAFFAFLLSCLGIIVVARSRRSDVTFAFLLSYAALLIVRAAWLGDPMMIPLHTLQNGALLLFAFFMISDPRTTPNARVGRLVYAFGVAVIAVLIQWNLYRADGIIWALVLCAPLVPLMDRVFPGHPYTWPKNTLTTLGPVPSTQGAF